MSGAAAEAAPPFPEGVLEAGQLERYAEAIVRACLHVRERDLVVVRAEPDHRELVVAVAEAAYRAGARLVEVAVIDRLLQAARIRHAHESDLGRVPEWSVTRRREMLAPDTASLRVVGEGDPGAFEGLGADRVALEHERVARAERALRRSALDGRRRGSVVAWPTPAWATQVFPGLETLEAQRRLARDLLSFCRLGPDDPPGIEGWQRHAERVVERGRALTDARLARLELRGPGTALDLALPEGTVWLGGPRRTRAGHPITPNFPTEENFASPVAEATEGTFRCSRPLSFRGRLIDGIRGELRGGRLVRLEAARAADRDALAAALDVDRGARRLGEVALVDGSSRIGRTGRIYYNTLLDENAAAHVAFGAPYRQTLPEGDQRLLNRSSLHLDVMIGTEDFEATGVRADGTRVPLIAGGRWQL